MFILNYILTGTLLFASYTGIDNEEVDATETVVEYQESRQADSHAIVGKVYDRNSHESLAGAKAKVVGYDMTCYTDFDGQFSFEGLEPGSYKIRLSYPSYKEVVTAELEVRDGQQCCLSIPLEQSML